MKTSGFLYDAQNNSGLGYMQPQMVVDRANSGGAARTPQPIIDKKNPGGGEQQVSITTTDNSTNNSGQPVQVTGGLSVPQRNMLYMIGGGIVSVIIISMIFNQND